MKSLARLAIAFVALSLPFASFADFISGDVSGGRNVSRSVTSSNAWVQSNPVDGSEVNFWTLTARAGDLLSIIVTAEQIELGVSVYQGLVQQMDLLIPGFANDASFGSNVFVAGTPSFGADGIGRGAPSRVALRLVSVPASPLPLVGEARTGRRERRRAAKDRKKE